MSGVAAEGAAGGGSGQAQALKDAGTGFNFLRPGFESQRDGVPLSGEEALGAHGTRRTIQYLAVILSIAKDLACKALAGVDHAQADRSRIAGRHQAVAALMARGVSTGSEPLTDAVRNGL